MKKNVLALILAAVLILSLVPAPAYAAELLSGYTVCVTGSKHGYTELLTGSSAGEGEEVRFLADPDEGYLATVYVGGISADAVKYVGYDLWAFSMPAGNVVIEVAYDPVPGEAHEIRVFAGKGGEYTIDRSSACQGESVFLSVRPDDPSGFLAEEHVFASGCELYLIYEEEGIYYYELFMPPKDVSIFVEYGSSGPYSVSVDIVSGEGGSVRLKRDHAWYGDTVTATITPDPGYELMTAWAVSHDGALISNVTGTGDQYSFTMHPGDTTLEVSFSRIYYPVSVSAGQGGTAYTDRDWARMGDTVTLVCQGDTGYVVDAITGVDHVTDLGGGRYSFVMPDAPVEIRVAFRAVTYPVTVVMETSLGGSIHADLTEAVPGQVVTLTARLEEGYRIAKLTGADCTDHGDGRISFVMPDSAAEIHAWILRTDNPFLDVRETMFCYEPILWAVEHGITNGLGPDHFGPGECCTRGQVVTFLWRAMGEPEPTIQENPFQDVQEGAYYHKAVLWAVEQGITTGVGEAAFDPDGVCSRAQVVTFLWRTYGKPEPIISGNPFADVPEGAYYHDAVAWAVEHQVTNGIGSGLFGPGECCTRGQVVTFLYRCDRIPTEEANPAA